MPALSQVGVTYNNEVPIEVLVAFCELPVILLVLLIKLITTLCTHVAMETKAIPCQIIKHQQSYNL